MKLIPKYKHAGTLNKEWVKDRDINGNWGYRNFKTGQFRTTLPNSQEEKKQERTKRNNAVLKTYSANKTRFDESYESRRRNHSDETVKKVISKPQITMDKSGNANTGYSTQLAPGEDSAQLNTFIEEQIPIVKGFRLATGLGKLALSKLRSNEVSHWARNSLVNEAAGDIASTVRAANTKAIAENFIDDWTQVRPNVEYRPLKGGPIKIEKDIVTGSDGKARVVNTETPVKFPEGQIEVFGQGRTPVWIEEGQQPKVINYLNSRNRYDFNYSETQGVNAPNSDIRIGLNHITYPEDKLVHYSSDLMSIRNNQFQPKPAESQLPNSFSAIWWERNHPATYGNSKLTFTKVPHTEGYEVANPTVFGDNQTITTGAYPITEAETMRPNPFTGFWDNIRYQEEPERMLRSIPSLNFLDERFLMKANSFANTYGYPKISYTRGVDTSADLESSVKTMLERHNTFARGVHTPDIEEQKQIKSIIGENATMDDMLQYVSTHGRLEDPRKRIFISGTTNAQAYSGFPNGRTALVQRKYTLGPDRNKWFDEADFKIYSQPESDNIAAPHIRAPWAQGKSETPETELSSENGELLFKGWAQPELRTVVDTEGNRHWWLQEQFPENKLSKNLKVK